jgi:ATP-dependent helicase/nuclease subunit B
LVRVDSYLAKQVAALCRDYPVRRKLLIVPSRQAGYNLTNWIAREGRGWANLCFETPVSLAERIARPSIEASGWRRLSADESFFEIHRAAAAALNSLPSEQVAPLAHGPGLTSALATTINALRLAGIEPDDVFAAPNTPFQQVFLRQVYRSYLDSLGQSNRYDAAQTLKTACDLADTSAYIEKSIIAVMDEVRLPALAFRFIGRCRSRATGFLRIGRPDFRVDPPKDSAATRLADVNFVLPAGEAVHPAGQVRVTRLKPADADRVQIRDAVGADAEVRGVFREIMAADSVLDDIEIVYTNAEPYLSLIATVADVVQVPVAYGEGLPVHLTRPGRAVSGFLRWVARDLHAPVLIHLLRSRLISISGSKATAQELAEILQSRRARKGREEHVAAFERERVAVRDRLRTTSNTTAITQRLERVDHHEAEVIRILDLVPERQATVADLADAATRFLTTFFRSGSDTDARALESILDRLHALSDIELDGPPAELAEMLADLMRRHRVGISAAQGGHLYAVPVSRAGYSGRSVTFVVGLDEGMFPGGATEDPLIPDHDRREISPELGENQSRPGERVWQLLRFLGSIPGKATLVANRFDLIDGRERYASSVVAQCREDLKMENPPRYAPSFTLPEAMTESEIWITQRDLDRVGEALLQRYPLVAAGAEAERHRLSPGITRYDGYLGQVRPELSLTNGEVLSASRLERIASCPYRYFLSDVLRVRPLDDADDDDHRWLNPRDFGSVVHEMLCDFMKQHKNQGDRPDLERDRKEMHALVESAASEARKRIPPETELSYRADVGRLKRTMDVFLAADSASNYVQALEFELRFGYSDGSPRYPNPVVLELGDGVNISLRGSIDRVDITRNGFVIWDYKTGSATPFSRSDLFDGEKLQWALYALAYQDLIDGLPTHLDVDRSGYFFVSERESGRRIAQAVPGRDELGRRLAPLLSMAEQGAFLHYQRIEKKASPCRFCDFRTVCEKERRDRNSLDAAMESSVPGEVLNDLQQWLTL